MDSKPVLLLAFLALAAGSASAQVVSETILDDRHVTAYENYLLGTSHSIAKWWFDDLVECHIVFPNGVFYQAYPVNNLPPGNVFYLQSTPPFNACGLGIRPVGFENAGVYELYSFVNEEAAGGITLTRQKFGVTVLPVDWRANELDE